MSHHLFSTRDSVRGLKVFVASKLPEIPSSHLSEALASAFGFRTNAALSHALKEADSIALPLPNSSAFLARLADLGYPKIARGWRGFPNFLSNGAEPIPKYTSTRARAWRNLMVAGINEGLRQRKFGLGPNDNFWDTADTLSSRQFESIGELDFILDHDLPATVTISDAGWGELSIHVGVNVRERSALSAYGARLDVADAIAAGWVERKLGVWLQNSGRPTLICRRALVDRIARIDVKPAGYSDVGKLMM